ncbi:MAG: hypothetical protein KGK08_03570 [Acidobacteriota bacterium]|nr:hypothetical protein [Acidobacteriota bacterium]
MREPRHVPLRTYRAAPHHLLVLALVVLAAGTAGGQQPRISWLDAQAARASANQPHWATPLVTTSPKIEQGLRTDFVRQSVRGGQQNWNLGNAKGLQVVLLPRLEVRVSPPPYLLHSNPAVSDGFGDLGLRLKYRLYGSNEQHHNAVVTADLTASLPTGKNTNGSCCALLSPMLGAGKGWGNLALTSTLSGVLPVSGTARLGRQMAWSTALQLHAGRYAWLQMESATTWYSGGSNDGHSQTLLTPGIVVSRLPLTRGTAGGVGPLSLTVGAGEQIAVTHFSTYNHAPVVSVRLRF